ncbi:hypothetical protein EJ02DRAFT_452379 [Clathrospora elynae]|uniref:HMG box domain-containing protein n=1 Tax=Clathrospora elynae TaxID=706981 RepID=A0A6A5T1D3_9PLEO|nr:hypothetical protein EJ02DRAFT_452379 [Clathrospora elynae]
MLARGALCRLAADVPKTPHKLPQLARLVRGTLLGRNATAFPTIRAFSRACTAALHARRSYATTARATKPTATVKKAVKAAAAKKPAPKKKAAPAKKAAPKKTVKKTAAKQPAAKKAAPKKRARKVVSPEDKEKAVIRELRVKALKAPVSNRPYSAFNAYVAEMCGGPANKGTTLAASNKKVIDASSKFRTLAPAELEHYNHIANEKTTARRAELQAWLKSYTPDQIKTANNARALLRRKLAGTLKKKKYPAHTNKLHDDRHVKQSPSAYILFLKDRYASGDFKGIKPTEATKLIGSEWLSLSSSEKKNYQDASLAAKAATAAA